MAGVYDELDRVRALYDAKGVECLSPTERLLLVVLELEAEVNGGGFAQFYANGPGDFAHEAADCYESIGASVVAQIIREANALFGAGGPPSDRQDRQAILEALGRETKDVFASFNERFYAYPDDIERLLGASIERGAETMA